MFVHQRWKILLRDYEINYGGSRDGARGLEGGGNWLRRKFGGKNGGMRVGGKKEGKE